jgi:hypothetical protein
MGRAYAGILGPLAFALAIARGLVHGWSVEGTLQTATAGLFFFAAFGYIAGQTADYLIRDSVRNRFQSAMADWKQQQSNTTQQNTTT